MKKIVVLNGSPRRKGNTSALMEAFAKGARRQGSDRLSDIYTI